MFENSYKTTWVNTRRANKSKRKLNIKELDGIFPQDKFDVTFYIYDLSKEPIFHIETNEIDMVFSIAKGEFLRHESLPLDDMQVDYVLSNFNKWYGENRKRHCQYCWDYIKYEYRNFPNISNIYDSLPNNLTELSSPIIWANIRSIAECKTKFNENEVDGLFPNSNFDIVIYERDHGTPRFHVENNDIDLVFSLGTCELLYKNEETKNKEMESYVLENIHAWYLKEKDWMDGFWKSGNCELEDADLSDENIERICKESFQKKESSK